MIEVNTVDDFSKVHKLAAWKFELPDKPLTMLNIDWDSIEIDELIDKVEQFYIDNPSFNNSSAKIYNNKEILSNKDEKELVETSTNGLHRKRRGSHDANVNYDAKYMNKWEAHAVADSISNEMKDKSKHKRNSNKPSEFDNGIKKPKFKGIDYDDQYRNQYQNAITIELNIKTIKLVIIMEIVMNNFIILVTSSNIMVAIVDNLIILITEGNIQSSITLDNI